MCLGGGGGGGQNTVTTQVEKLPEELVPFYEDLLGRGTYESLTGYVPYPSRRLAEFDPYEGGAQKAYAEMALAGTPESFRESQAVAREAAIGSPYQRALMADQATQEMMRGVGEYRRNRPQFADIRTGAVDFTQPGTQEDYLADQGDLTGLEGAAIGNLKGLTGTTIGNLKGLKGTTIGNLKNLTGEAVGDIGVAGFGDEGILKSYMNPYQQNFLDVQKRLATEESERAANQIAAQAAMSGGLGGYREGIMQSERERNLGEQLQDIQSRGDMENYLQARQAFEADRAADYTADVANRQAALQFGEADRQAAFQFGQADRDAALRFGEADRQAALQFGEADRQARFQDLAQARQAFEQDRQANIQRAEFNRAGLGEAAQLGMQGYGSLGQDIDRRMMAGQRMSDLTGTRQAMEYDRLGQLESAGQRRRALAQQGLDIGYQDFLRQQAFPREQLNLYSSMLRGIPVGPGQYTAMYGNTPSPLQQMVGAGISGIGAYNSLTGGGGGWGGTG